jgi:hypothetical protein
VVSAGSYAVSAFGLLVLLVSLGGGAFALRARLLPDWEGAPARLVEAVIAVALLIWLAELLGTLQILYGWLLIVLAAVLAAAFWWRWRPLPGKEPPAARGPAGERALLLLVTVGVIGLVTAHWGLTTKDALDRGIFNFDSLWYHMPFAAHFAQTHSTTGFLHPETVFTNWFYPQNSELLHGVGILIAGRDTLSLFINFGWLALAFLSAWCIGRPFGRGPLSVGAAAIVLECHTLVVREPGAAKNDLAAAALILAAIAILVTAWTRSGEDRRTVGGAVAEASPRPVGWALAVAGLAVGLAVGTRLTVVAMAAALSLAVLALAPAGRRRAAAAWWFLPALAGGGYWYLRNLVAAGNPLPEVERLGPISLPHPERLQSGRPDFNIVHYATDTGVWRHYFAPALHEQLGVLWPLVVLGAGLGTLAIVLRGRGGVVRWMAGVALFGLIAYLFTPLSAAGPEGEPTAFGINLRYAVPPLLAALTLLPLAPGLDGRRRQWGVLAVLVVALVLTDRSDAVVRDPARVFAIALAIVLVLVPAALLYARARGAVASAVAAAFAALLVALAVVGYPLQRHYLDGRFANTDPATSIPGMHLDSAYRWARGTSQQRIGLAGTTAGFLQYGFFATDLTNRVIYLGDRGPRGAYNAIPTCGGFRAAVNAADLDYLVTSPFLNFIHTDRPIPSPEAGWLRGEGAVRPILRSGPVTVWKVRGRLDPGGCGSRNAPLRHVPDTPPA